MIIENEFTVTAGLEEVWRQLLDMEGVATCLPGATISATEEENVYNGSMRLKIGPMRVEYRGTATLTEVDDQSHTAVIALSAREAKGQGSARATIRNQLESVEDGTRVTARTDLQITGPQAQFGRGVIEDVGKRVLREFSACLEQKIGGRADGTGAAAGGDGDAAGGHSGQAAQAAAAGRHSGQAAQAAAAGGPGEPSEEAAGVAPGASTGAGAGATGPGFTSPEVGAAGAYSGAASPEGAPEVGTALERTSASVPSELDVGSLLASSPAVRRAAAAVAALLVLVAMIVLRRRR